MIYNRQQIIKLIDEFFNSIQQPEKIDIIELVSTIESIIPVHVELVISDYDQVDVLLSIYPYLFQKLIKTYSYFIHQVRIGRQNKDKTYVDIMINYRDPIELMLKAIKMQYDALSRRITNNIERRG